MAAVVTGVVVLIFCIPLAFFVRSVATDRAIDGASLEASSLAAELYTVKDRPTMARLTSSANEAAETPVTVYLVDGQVLGAVSGSPAAVPAIVRAGLTATLPGPAGEKYVWAPVRHPSASIAVVVSVPSSLLTKGVAREWFLLFGGGFLLVLVAIVLADWMGRTIVRPISELEDVTHSLSDGDLERRVVPAGPYEVAEVGRAVNELADRIDALLAGARMAGADLGHRLRTPLTALRLDLEALTDSPTRTTLNNDLEELELAVNRLIRETREPPRPPGHADLAGIVRDRMAFWAVLARSQRRVFSIEAPSCRVEVPLERDELGATIDALVSNIFAHTPEGTGFRVALQRTPPGSELWTFVVEDDGPALSGGSEYRSPRNAGTGLGLDIVRRTTERAGGAMTVGHSLSGGFRVELTFRVAMATGSSPTGQRHNKGTDSEPPDDRPTLTETEGR
ncbi:MAG: HAMP domain-containing sensor histidine kinase [Acidimicrobiales bacterium]